MPPDIVTARIGQEVTVRLFAAPSAGYGWELDPLPEGVRLLGSGYEKPPADQPPGSFLQQVFRLQAQAPGEHSLMFRYKRPWESNVLQSKTVSLIVR